MYLLCFTYFARIGCLPYSQHARAKVSLLADGSVEYYDWWGYEITMVEVLASKHNFTWGYFPPADGLWGALEDSGNMSGLIGQAAYGEVDWVLSGVMETRDRWRVADNPISFDSDYMVFVSPPPVKVSKASAPIRPFNLYVSIEDPLGECRAVSCSDVEYRDRHHSPLQSGTDDDGLAPPEDRPGQN